MSCIKEERIQKYIDEETTATENSIIEKHLSICETCKNKVETQRRLAFGLKKAIHLLEKDAIEIPLMIKPKANSKKSISLRKKIIYFSAVAAGLLLFALIINREESRPIQGNLIITTSFNNEYDANKTISQQSMVVNIIDSDGNVIEIFIQ